MIRFSKQKQQRFQKRRSPPMTADQVCPVRWHTPFHGDIRCDLLAHHGGPCEAVALGFLVRRPQD